MTISTGGKVCQIRGCKKDAINELEYVISVNTDNTYEVNTNIIKTCDKHTSYWMQKHAVIIRSI